MSDDTFSFEARREAANTLVVQGINEGHTITVEQVAALVSKLQASILVLEQRIETGFAQMAEDHQRLAQALNGDHDDVTVAR